MPSWTKDQIPSQSGKTYIVTGANSGLGLHTTLILAAKGATVVMACRNAERAQRALQRVQEAAPRARVETMTLDLADLASIRRFADAFLSRYPKLDVLVNNAGLMAIPQAQTADGFEMQIGTNHFGHFALTSALIERLLASAPARIVNLSSSAHRFGRMNFDDLHSRKRYDAWVAYGQSKLANLLFTLELQRRLDAKFAGESPLLALAAHPGYAATELQGKAATLGGSQLQASILAFTNRVFAQSAEMGAMPTLRACVDPDVKGGEYFGPGGFLEGKGPPIRVGMTPSARDPESARRLWEISLDQTGATYPF